jgi:hypothetical protein
MALTSNHIITMSEATQNYVRIPLTQGKFAIISVEDLPEIGKYRWCHSTGFASRIASKKEIEAGADRKISMHRQIMGFPQGLQVDHANGDTLDNSRDNLRIANKAQNMCNRVFSKTPSSGMLGISKMPNKVKQSWYARIRVNGKSEYLGRFDSLEDAIEARDKRGRDGHKEFFVLDRPPLKEHSVIPIADKAPSARAPISGLRGVYRRKSGRWCASFYHKGVSTYLGDFDDPTLASAAVEAKFKELQQ